MSDEGADLEATKQEARQTVDPVKSFLSGGFGGMSAVLVGHPFDLTKTRLQTAAPGTSLLTSRQAGADEAQARILELWMSFGRLWLGMESEGEPRCPTAPHRGRRLIDGRMYRGMLPPLIGVTPIFAISFWVSFVALYFQR